MPAAMATVAAAATAATPFQDQLRRPVSSGTPWAGLHCCWGGDGAAAGAVRATKPRRIGPEYFCWMSRCSLRLAAGMYQGDHGGGLVGKYPSLAAASHQTSALKVPGAVPLLPAV